MLHKESEIEDEGTSEIEDGEAEGENENGTDEPFSEDKQISNSAYLIPEISAPGFASSLNGMLPVADTSTPSTQSTAELSSDNSEVFALPSIIIVL